MPDFRMTIASDPGQVVLVSNAFAAFAETHKVPAAVRRAVSVALDELLHNTRAYGSAAEVNIVVELEGDRVRATLSDDGKPFNPLDLTAPDTGLSVPERPIGGLGIHLTRQLMDEMTYQRQADRNVVTLTKFLP